MLPRSCTTRRGLAPLIVRGKRGNSHYPTVFLSSVAVKDGGELCSTWALLSTYRIPPPLRVERSMHLTLYVLSSQVTSGHPYNASCRLIYLRVFRTLNCLPCNVVPSVERLTIFALV